MKEMAVRKVLGASSQRLYGLLAREYLIIVGVSNLIAAPIAYYLAEQWLVDFAFRIDFDPWLLLIAGVVTTTVAIIAISGRSITAVRSNPAMILKIE